MTLDLRPLSIPELLDRSVGLYRKHLRLFVGIMAVPSALGLLVALPANIISYTGQSVAGTPAAPALSDVATIVGLFVGYFVFIVLLLVIYMLALGATSVGVAELYQNGSPTIGSTYARVRAQGFDLVMLALHSGARLFAAFVAIVGAGAALTGLLAMAIGPFAVVFMFTGMFASFVVCIVMVLRYSLAVPALVLERLSARQAIRRSVALTRDNLGRAFLIVFCATMITYASVLLFQGPFMFGALLAGPDGTLPLLLTIAGTIVGTIGSALTAPVMIIGLAVLYYDARVRKEALDVQLMIHALDEVAPPAAMPTPSTTG